MQIHDINLQKASDYGLYDNKNELAQDVHNESYSSSPLCLSSHHDPIKSSLASRQARSSTPPMIDKRLHLHFVGCVIISVTNIYTYIYIYVYIYICIYIYMNRYNIYIYYICSLV